MTDNQFFLLIIGAVGSMILSNVIIGAWVMGGIQDLGLLLIKLQGGKQ